jgi:hypothetical protein
MRLETSNGGVSKSCEPITGFYDDGPARFELEHVSIVRQMQICPEGAVIVCKQRGEVLP